MDRDGRWRKGRPNVRARQPGSGDEGRSTQSPRRAWLALAEALDCHEGGSETTLHSHFGASHRLIGWGPMKSLTAMVGVSPGTSPTFPIEIRKSCTLLWGQFRV